MCRSAANIIKVKGTIITFEGGDRADFGQVAEGCVRRAEADVKDVVGIKQRARVVEPVVSISLRNDVSDRPDASYTMGPGPTCLVAVLHAASVIGCWGCVTGAASIIVCW